MITPETLKEIRVKRKLSQKEFGERLGLSRELIGKMENGTLAISRSTEILVEDYVKSGKDTDEYIDKEKNSELNTETEVVTVGKTTGKSVNKTEAFPGWMGVPMFNEPISASFVTHYRDNSFHEPQFYLRDPRFKDCNFGSIITGDSMDSEIRHGDFVVCQEITDKSFIVFGEIYYIIAKNGLETCKYINADPEDRNNLMLVPKNQAISPSPIPKTMIDRLYKVKGILRGY